MSSEGECQGCYPLDEHILFNACCSAWCIQELSATKTDTRKLPPRNVSTQYIQLFSHSCMWGAHLLSTLSWPICSSITLHFSVHYKGGKPDSAQGKFPPWRWLSHRCKCRILLLPSLSQAMDSSSSPKLQVHMSLRLNSCLGKKLYAQKEGIPLINN